jgi:preprotein translocase subunit YajC
VISIPSTFWLLLAEASDAANKVGGNAPAKPQGAQGIFDTMLPGLVIVMVLFYLFMIRPQKARDQQLRSAVDNLKETDRVVTIGGIYGVVTNVQRDAGTVTLRVDESSGTKIRVNTSAIARVIKDEDKAE